MRPWVAPTACLVLAAGLAYSNTFDVPFTFDDDQHVVDGAVGRTVLGALGECGRQNRCVGFATFAMNHALDGLKVRGYHAFNLAIHGATGLLVYALVLLLARTPRLQGRWAPRVPTVAFGAALLFLVHPLQTMAVTYVVQRFASLMACFYLLAVVTWLAGRLTMVASHRWLLNAASLVSAVLALKTKENAITLPLALGLLEWTFFEGPRLPRLGRLWGWAVLLVLPAVVTLGSASLNGGLDGALRSNTSMSRLAFASTQLTVIPAYLRLVALPVGQSVEHAPPPYSGPWHAAPLTGAALLVALLVTALRWLRRGPEEAAARVLAGFGVLWFFLAISVEASVLPIRDLMVEHRVYLPSVGLFLAVSAWSASVVDRLAGTRPFVARLAVGLSVLTPVALGAATFARNELWRDEPELWRQAIAQASGARLQYANTNAGKALLERGRCVEAIPYFEAALASEAPSLTPLLDLGLCSAALGDRPRAYQRFEQARVLAPLDARAPAQLARLASEDGDLTTARALYEQALALSPENAEVRAGLGATLGQLGLLGEAQALLEQAVAEAPCSAMAWGNLGNVRSLREDARGAEEAWRHALQCDPTDAAARANLTRFLEHH